MSSKEALKPAWCTTKVGESKCPFCDHNLSGASSPDGHTPKVGDISICISCASLLVFIEDLKIRTMTHDEFLNLAPQEKAEIRKFQDAVHTLDRRTMKNN